MNFDEATIIQTQKSTGFDLLYIEKVLRLLDILELLFSHDELRDKYALKGGTALNLFCFKLPRLSVDIDLNYLGLERDVMLKDRENHEAILSELLTRCGYVLKRVPAEHAGGKWRLGYRSFSGIQQNIELDLNYMHRLPLFPVQKRDSFPLGEQFVRQVPILDIHELAAGKLCALLARCKPRDLFDGCNLLRLENIDTDKLRRCFVVYAAFNKVDFSTINGLGELKFDTQQFRQELIETLAHGIVTESPEQYLASLVQECKDRLGAILPFTDKERMFLEAINCKGELHPELLTDSPEFRQVIMIHPMLQWKIFNVRKHFGL